MAGLVVVAALGLGLAWLSRGGVLASPPRGAGGLAAVRVPDDLWAAFEAVSGADAVADRTSGSGASSTATATTTGRRSTVGALAPGDTGFVAFEALVMDAAGIVWLDAAAVVHPAARAGRLAIRRTDDAYELQDPRDAGPVEMAEPSRTSIRIDSLFH